MIQLRYPFGATPLDPDEIEGLIPTHISTQSELNEWEQQNILEAEQWITRHIFAPDTVLDLLFIKKLHKKMFSDTWRWAGEFRKTEKNIGIDWLTIAAETKKLLDDVRYQLNQQTYALDEIAARFHHRLVAIHLFCNGNGRHARLIADILLLSQQQPRFTWGQNSRLSADVLRKQYITALQAADRQNYAALFNFVRS